MTEAAQIGGTQPAVGGPVAGADRLVSLDFIRGIAVLGILFANIVAFGHPMLAYAWPGAFPAPPGPADKALWLVQYLLIDGKMRGLFTLLFGAGMALFVDHALARGASAWLQLRRLAWLMLFGVIHFFLLFWGDILFIYAFSGMVALPMVRMQASVLLAVGIVWYLVGGLFFALMFVGAVQLERSAELAPQAYETLQADWRERERDAAAELAAFRKGNYAEEVAFTWRARSHVLSQSPTFALIETVPLMLIGMALYRFGMFSGGLDPGAMRRWGWAGVIAGIALTLPLGLWAVRAGFPPYLTEFVFNAAPQIPRLPMVIGLAALLALWAPRAATGRLGGRVVAAGRMALSNYIGTSIVMMLVFRHWAGGLFGELARPALLVVVALGWLTMLAWSRPWLARFRYGPLEWAWRCLTYGRFFPLRR